MPAEKESSKSRTSTSKRESSESRETLSNSITKPPDQKPTTKTTKGASVRTKKPEPTGPYTKPDRETLKKSAPLNAKLKPNAKPDGLTISKQSKSSSRTAKTSSDDTSISKTSTRSKSDSKGFSRSKPPDPKPSSKSSERSSTATSSSRRPSVSSRSGPPKSLSREAAETKARAAREGGAAKDHKSRSANDTAEPTNSRTTRSKTGSSSDRAKEPPKNRTKESSKDRTKEPSKDRTKETSKDRKKEPSTNRIKEPSKDRAKKPSKDRTKEPSKDRVDDSAGDRDLSRPSGDSDDKKTSRLERRTSVARVIPAVLEAPLLLEGGGAEHDGGGSQYSLDTQESGISVSTPKQGREDSDEVDEDVEASISSRQVEVDEAEMVDEMIAVVDEDEVEEEPVQEALEGGSDDSGVGGDMFGGDNGVPSMDEEGGGGAGPRAASLDEEDPYGDDEFEDYDSDFEATDDEGENEDNDDKDEVEEEDDDSEEESDEDADTDDEIAVLHTEGGFETASLLAAEGAPNTEVLVAGRQRNHSISSEMVLTMDEETSRPVMRPKTSKSFVNFAKLKEKHGVNQMAQADSRGQTLLSMIRLDTVSLDLLTLQPINYEVFISSFGLHNTQQAGVQTNEDNLAQESQTEPVSTLDKWTQQPISVDVGPNMTEPPTSQDYLGVGGDMGEAHQGAGDNFGSRAAGNVARLTKFLVAASQVVLSLLEEETMYQATGSQEGGSKGHGSGGGGFSSHGVMLGGATGGGEPSTAALLAGGSVTCIHFSTSDPSVLLTGHSFEERPLLLADSPTDYSSSFVSSSGLVCVWSVHEPSQPRHLLRCHAAPLCLALCPGRPLVAMAGLQDASLATWDLREPAHLHPRCSLDQEGQLLLYGGVGATRKGREEEDEEETSIKWCWRCRVPSFITACSGDDSSGGPSGGRQSGATDQSSAIISLEAIDSSQQDGALGPDTAGAFQVVSLASCGELVWWVVVQQRGRVMAGGDDGVVVSSHKGASPWSKLVVNKASSYTVTLTGSPGSDLLSWVWCSDCALRPDDHNSLYVSTGTGAVRHLHRLGQRQDPPAYLPDIEPSCSSTCVAVCPHLTDYLLVGCSDGGVRLHSIKSPRPLALWPSPTPESPQPVVKITWSTERPCVFYVHELECIHVWDLSAGDMSPLVTLTTDALMGEEGPMVFSLSPSRLHNRAIINAVFGSSTGRLVLRTVDTDFLNTSTEEYHEELDRFKYYVNII